MVDVEQIARDAGRGARDGAADVAVPELADVRTGRRRRSAITAAAGAFVVTIVVVGVATLGGSNAGGGDVAAPGTTVDTDAGFTALAAADGVEMAYPDGWFPAPENLTPGNRDPLELVSVATFPLSAGNGGCDGFPRQAVVDFPAGGALVTLRERFRNIDPDMFPPRPDTFASASTAYVLPEGDCLDNTSRGDVGEVTRVTFTDSGRSFELIVVFGTGAAPTVADEAWAIADSLVVRPGSGVPGLTTETVYGGNAFVLDRGTGPEVCGAVQESLPPQCGGPRLRGLDWAEVPWAQSAQDVTWADMYLEVTVVEGEFVLVGSPSERRAVDAGEPPFSLPPSDLDVRAVFDDLVALRPDEWPAGIVGVYSYSPNDAEGYVEIGALLVTTEGQQWLDDRYGTGAVRATGSFLPVADIETSDLPPPAPMTPSLQGEPDAVRAREPLYYCGAALVGGIGGFPDDLGVTPDPGALECFSARVAGGEGAEVITVRVTIEGDPIVWIMRALPTRAFEIYVDATRDHFGSAESWTYASCGGFDLDAMTPENCNEALPIND